MLMLMLYCISCVGDMAAFSPAEKETLKSSKKNRRMLHEYSA
jgi:hypothetical protein